MHKLKPPAPVLGYLAIILLVSSGVAAAERWSKKLDGKIVFYQSTELGVLITGTEKSVYALDAETGEVLWRRKDLKLEETDVAPVSGTDLALMTIESKGKTRLEAVDLLSGDSIWKSEKVRGSVLQMALDQTSNLIALIVVRDGRSRPKEDFKRKPIVYVVDITNGKELWKRELENEIEMMPSRWTDNGDEVPFTLDNYRPPVFLDNRLYLFYEGLTSQEAFTGKDRRSEKFRVNEEGLALTEADPVADERFVYTSGRGKIRAVSHGSGEETWEAKDLGSVPEMILTRDVLYARTGGQFARLKDGEIVARGPYGVSAIATSNGKTLWRYKGADKGITNLSLADLNTLVTADKDDLIVLDAASGKRRTKLSHRVEAASFVIINGRGEAVVGGKNELAAFDLLTGRNTWRVRHNPPGRGLIRTVGAIAARATALYFRYGGTTTTAVSGVQILNTMNSLRWSGLVAREALPSLTTLASNTARDYTRARVSTYGLLARARQNSSGRSPRIVTTPSGDVQERLLDRLDPAHQFERLSRFLLRTRRLAALRGDWMYFYTRLDQGEGLVGVNVNTGIDERSIRLPPPDERFLTDEITQLLYMSRGDRLHAFRLTDREW
jgi:outer membrane protein assembly factor BamB